MTTAGPNPLSLLTVEEAADVLRIGRTSMFALVKDGTIRSVRIGRLRRIPSESIVQFVNDRLGVQ